MQVRELKQYIQWLIDNDLDEYHNDRDYKNNWRHDILNCQDDNIEISQVNNEYGDYYNIILNNDKSGYLIVFNEYINEWKVINRKQKLERICNHIDI